MGSELTYLLGAGASFQSMPIVKTFPSRFNDFVSFLNSNSRDILSNQEKKDAFQIAHGIALKHYDAFKTHQSFDTYFKKLFHTNQTQKIIEAKKVLNLYFIWEHLCPLPQLKQNEDKKNDLIFFKQSKVDKRYDALVAGILKPLLGKSEPYCPVNFITWNYDLNLLMSLKNYFSPLATIGDFLQEIDKKNSIWQIGKKISVINLNGFFYSSLFSTFSNLENLTDVKKGIREIIRDILFEKIKEKYFEDQSADSDSEMIRFAWESSSEIKIEDLEIVKCAKDKMNNSPNIVIIGYTFPLYNRLVDFQYFNTGLLLNKKIYIQDPNAIDLKRSFISDFSIDTITSNKSQVSEITNCDSFFIPSNIYRYVDSLDKL